MQASTRSREVEGVGGAVGEGVVGLVRAEDEDGEVGDGVGCGG